MTEEEQEMYKQKFHTPEGLEEYLEGLDDDKTTGI